VKPFPVLLARRFVGPPEELALFLEAGQKKPAGVVLGVAQLKHGGLTAKAQQALSHVANVWMRLTIHLPHIVEGYLFSTKQQTRIHGTYDIFLTLLGLALLQTNLLAGQTM